MKESSGKSRSGDRYSAAFRAPPLPDCLGLARAIIETAPEEATGCRILADNPAKLFGF